MNTLTIAIIDEDKVDRLISKKLIERISPRIKTIDFSAGMEALQYLTAYAVKEDKLPHIILLDIRMPVFSGWEYLTEYQNIASLLIRKPQHYIYTSSIDPEDINSRHADVSGVYTKPFERDSLLRIIRAAEGSNKASGKIHQLV